GANCPVGKTMNLAAKCCRLTIRQKLQLIIMSTAGAAVVLVCAVVVAYDQMAFRDSMRTDLGILAEIFGSNSTAALSFGDRKSADELLLGLKAKAPIVRAFLYSADGGVFAGYRRGSEGSGSPVPPIRPDGSWLEDERRR